MLILDEFQEFLIGMGQKRPAEASIRGSEVAATLICQKNTLEPNTHCELSIPELVHATWGYCYLARLHFALFDFFKKMLLLSVLKKGYAVGRLSNNLSAPKFFKEQASLTTHGTSLCEDAS